MVTAPPTHSADAWIERLALLPHPEGGHYRETWRSPGSVRFEAHPDGPRERAYVTSIHYLLRGAERSRLHRIASDELWCFHAGDPLTVHVLDDGGLGSSFTLGLGPGQAPQGVVRAGGWFGAALTEPRPDAYALVSCVVAPGFDFEDLAFADRGELVARFPAARAIIERLT